LGGASGRRDRWVDRHRIQQRIHSGQPDLDTLLRETSPTLNAHLTAR
jgi:hypothetical protein